MPWLCTRLRYLNRGGTDDLPRAFTTWIFAPPSDRLCDPGPDYKYSLKDCQLPERQFDPVLQVIVATIRELAVDNMYVAAAKIRVRNATSSPPIWPMTGNRESDSGVKFYVFHPYYDEFPMTVPVAMFDRRAGLSADKLFVRSKSRWESLRTWLLQLPDIKILDGYWCRDKQQLEARRIQTQQVWWRCNGKHFPLMDLPTELYFEVLRHALGGEIHPFVIGGPDMHLETRTVPRRGGQSHVVLGRQAYSSRENAVPGTEPPNYALLRVSKQVRREALNAAWVGTRKCFVTPPSFFKVISLAHKPSAQYNWISKVELDFTISDWFDFFGVEIHPALHASAGFSMGPLLQGINTLKSLRLRFRSPYGGRHYYKNMMDPNPWQWFQALYKHTDWFQSNEMYRDMRTSICYKTVVDWILTFAYPYIHHIPNVILAGCVKKEVRERWTHRLATGYRLRRKISRKGLSEAETLGYNWQADMDLIGKYPSHSPPRCSCPVPCDLFEMRDFAFRHNVPPEIYRVFDHDDEWTEELNERVVWLITHAPQHLSELVLYGPQANSKSLIEKYRDKYNNSGIQGTVQKGCITTEAEE
ncbi:uncharacterized protein EI97DRAFT_417785 [Westerdykella ornata]|uniref:Uncharacterized protein n=1 Tax=Westerdykella ornata TaxID=318751 RepID=A0A6A6JJY2_WESOR|nr:uncharacterized protein EI97DRAFT_417785 [Westerdykella ornata]KAF2276772.1 hypothetical protein EI97DRAFT_417785 [Westerdykella ornata]